MLNLMAFLRPGFWEIVVILTVVLLVFGAARLPKIGASLGEAIRGFKKAVKDEPDGGNHSNCDSDSQTTGN